MNIIVCIFPEDMFSEEQKNFLIASEWYAGKRLSDNMFGFEWRRGLPEGYNIDLNKGIARDIDNSGIGNNKYIREYCSNAVVCLS